ncbi:MAG: alkaline phosphatase [Oligoflexia bacterium]|nr:alkaline phosphatase [Oligoflexia bacterium]
MIKNLTIVIIFALFLLVIISEDTRAKNVRQPQPHHVRNVILLIPDGTGTAHSTFARWYNGGVPLAMDEIATGLIRTYAADAPITDSAPAATAMATGFKTIALYIGILPSKKQPFLWGVPDIFEEEEEKPVATVLEAAKLAGKSVGLVATIFVEHATPAGFSAHTPFRNDFETIAKQQVYNGIDVALSGGAKFLKKENRKDREDLAEILKKKNYQVVTNRNEMNRIVKGKVWGVFAEDDLSNDFDRDQEIEPSLEEMTTKAIQLLSKNSKGFFLMVEGSKVDWSSHKNDPVGIVSELLAFDRAVKVALNFAKKRNDTAIIVAADHNNGGFAIGSHLSDMDYQTEPLAAYLTATKKAKHTLDYVLKEISKYAGDANKIREIITSNYIPNLTDEEFNELKKLDRDHFAYKLVSFITKRDAIAFTTSGHGGEDVPLYCYHPDFRSTLRGVVLNSDIGKYIAKILNVDLANATRELFVPLNLNSNNSDNFNKSDKSDNSNNSIDMVKIDMTDENNPALILVKNARSVKLPVNTNIIIVDNKEYALPGITILNQPKLRAYVSKKAFDYLLPSTSLSGSKIGSKIGSKLKSVSSPIKK